MVSFGPGIVEKEKKALRRVYELIIVNTIGSKNVPDLVEGAVISTFGLLLCFFGLLVSAYLASPVPSGILKLGLLGYLLVLLYHFISIRELRLAEKPGKQAAAAVFFSKFVCVLLLLAIIDVAIGLGRMLGVAANASSRYGVFISALPALLIIGAPLFFWQQLCEHTAIDDFVRRKLNE